MQLYPLHTRVLEEWQASWKNGVTGRKIYNIVLSVSVPLTGLERMLSSLNMDLSLPTSKGFTCLTAIIAVVVELARHFTICHGVYLYSVLAYEEASAKLRTRMAEKGRQ
ncbi:hypothetical protein AVEN_57684-1 [Araneus ventricosus]|uniref:Uncharacterized protein n=1 Tax=Araneus ventricosus TaxID=182803 RepID=A0A4Y2MX53_ARAVE|nr:hypothetical protein AVEN_57684-1 [Araneus ventricosus]